MGGEARRATQSTGARDIVARLASGSRGHTEAEIQADVRAFLLEADLELEPGQVLDVSLEAQAGGGRRIDVEAGRAAIEVKKRLESESIFEDAKVQLARYVKQRTEERGQRYVGVLTDGKTWVLLHLDPADNLAEVSRFTLRTGDDGKALAAWLEPVLATIEKITPTPGQIVRRLGSDCAATQLDLADLRALYYSCRDAPEVQLKRELWARLLLSALGTNFEDSDDLFVTHTYLVLAAELIAHEVMGYPVATHRTGVRPLLEGERFVDFAGLRGVVEADFFDWPATVSSGEPIVSGIARRMSTFDWTHVAHDVLKALYESVIDAETRHKMGEYYTPDWLAQKMVDEEFCDPLRQRMLDPACGSGTFLFWAVRRLLQECDAAGIPNCEALERVVAQVQGMDLHPVAVTLARVTYLLALTRERLLDPERGDLTVPVFLGDSVRWEQGDTVLTADGMTVPTADPSQLIDDTLHFPEAVVEDPARFDRLVEALAKKAAEPRASAKPPAIRRLLNAHEVLGQTDRDAVELTFKKLCRLHDAGRDHLWSYYIRNLARPLAFMRTEGQADVAIGNPPWLAYRHMPRKLQAAYRRLADERGLWAGGEVATHQDLSDLFVARSVEQYLTPMGRFAFVMPFAVLSRRQFTGFRSGDWSGPDQDTLVQFGVADDFARVKPPPFQVPSCVIAGKKATSATPLRSEARIWSGRVPSRHADWATASEHLDYVTGGVADALESESRYRTRFRQGAPFVPRVLLKVQAMDAGPLGVSAGRIPVRSARSAFEKRPWKDLSELEGVVERRFVRRVHLGASIVAYRVREPEMGIVPWAEGDLIGDDDERLDEFPGLAAWWRNAERVWEKNKAPATRLTLMEQLNFQGKLGGQFPVAPHRVVYTRSGQHLAACRIDDTDALIEQTLYWASVESVAEARYLTAVLNSKALQDAVTPLQSRGQHNPRDFALRVFAFPFPLFDHSDRLHLEIAALSERAEDVATDVNLEANRSFQAARRQARIALREDGVADEVDAAVEQLMRETPAPDLMAVLSEAESATARPPRRRRETPHDVLPAHERVPDPADR